MFISLRLQSDTIFLICSLSVMCYLIHTFFEAFIYLIGVFLQKTFGLFRVFLTVICQDAILCYIFINISIIL